MKIVRIQPTVNLEPVVLCPWISQVNHRLTDQSDVPWPLMVYLDIISGPILHFLLAFFGSCFTNTSFKSKKKSSQFWWSWKTRCLWIKCHTSLKKKMKWIEFVCLFITVSTFTFSTHSVELNYVFFCQSLQISNFNVICNTRENISVNIISRSKGTAAEWADGSACTWDTKIL